MTWKVKNPFMLDRHELNLMASVANMYPERHATDVAERINQTAAASFVAMADDDHADVIHVYDEDSRLYAKIEREEV